MQALAIYAWHSRGCSGSGSSSTSRASTRYTTTQEQEAWGRGGGEEGELGNTETVVACPGRNAIYNVYNYYTSVKSRIFSWVLYLVLVFVITLE